MITLTPEKEAQLRADFHARQEKLRQELAEPAQARAHFKTVMQKRNAPKIVTANKRHVCSVCAETILEDQKAWYTPGRVAAKSTRCSDPAFTQSKYTCLRCKPAEADKQ